MKTSATVRREIETALYARVPGALSPQVRAERVRVSTGVAGVDEVARGGFPVGAITEIVGAESSGRTTLAVSFAARRLAEGMVLAWVDGTDSLDPESVAAGGVDLERMLWVRCGGEREASPAADALGAVRGAGAASDRDLSVGLGSAAVPGSAPSVGGGCGSPHPRGEGRGMPEAIGGLMGGLGAGVESRPTVKSQPGGNRALLPVRRKDKSIGTPGAPNRTVEEEAGLSWRSKDREEQVATDRLPARRGDLVMSAKTGAWEPRCAGAETGGRRSGGVRVVLPGGGREVRRGGGGGGAKRMERGPWRAIDQALRATDLLLQAGGFGVIVLDLGGMTAEAVWRIPMATWFRFRAAAERSQTCFVLLTQHACARSSAELVLEMETGAMEAEGRVMTGVGYRANVGRQRFVAMGVAAEKVVRIRERELKDKGEASGSEFEGTLDGVAAGSRRPPQPERLGDWHGQAAWAKASGVAGVRGEAETVGVRGRTQGRAE